MSEVENITRQLKEVLATYHATAQECAGAAEYFRQLEQRIIARTQTLNHWLGVLEKKLNDANAADWWKGGGETTHHD